MMMTPKQVVRRWIDYFNQADVEGLLSLYAEDAVNDQVVFNEPLRGRAAIREMFTIEFGRATMICQEERLHECGEWAILQWRDPLGLRGCGFFCVQQGLIQRQIGYFDQLSFFKAQGLAIPDDYLGKAT